ncbi:MAG: Asp-tRNA(Asn)/Glu-tRNA(Gln) amidotransferase subunit GatB [Betaproteobacteria bacterium]
MPAGWEVVIGLETHTQLSTVSKIFSGAPTAFGADPNTQASAVDLALPGTLPVLNKGAVERAIKFGLAVGGAISPRSIFARKNYFYPDLPKGYQISQYELPVVVGGEVRINVGGAEKVVQLTRAHLEEDAGKSLHEGLESPRVSGIDLNRAGTPLLEIVSEPDMRSADEAVAYAKALHGIVTWIGICDGNMQEGSFRCDANVSVRRLGDDKLGTRCEVKNVNSFRFLERAIRHEIKRQIELIEDGGKVVQETRLYDADRDETRSMRSKEDAMDYRYFPDPDLLPLEISQAWIDDIRAGMPELPRQMRDRFVAEYGLSAYDAGWVTSTRAHAGYFVAALGAHGAGDLTAAAKQVANWMTSDLAAALNREDLDIAQSRIAPASLAILLKRLADGTLSGKMAKEVFGYMWSGEGDADAIIGKRGLKQVSDSGAIEKMIDDVIAANPKSVEEYKAGKDKALNALFGQVMKASNKTANPSQVTEILKRKLAG